MEEENRKKSSSKKSSSSTTKKTTTKKTTSKKATTTKKAPVKKVEVVKEEPVVEKMETEKKPVEELYTPNMSVMAIVTVLLAAILVVIYMVTLFMKAQEVTYSEAWKDKSYLVEKELAPKISCDELANATLGNESFIFVLSYSEEAFELEKDMAKLIKEYHLQDDFYVYTLDDNCGPISEPESIVGQNLKLTKGLNKIPAILFYRNGSLEEVVEREDEKMIEIGDFQKLLDIYEISK